MENKAQFKAIKPSYPIAVSLASRTLGINKFHHKESADRYLYAGINRISDTDVKNLAEEPETPERATELNVILSNP